MSETPSTAEHFSRHAANYVDSPGHAAGADLDVVEAFAGPKAQDRCLDVATGPGHTALRMARSAAHVIGTDIAPGMIAAARRQAADRGIANAEFHLADAAALPFADASFDLVTCRIAPHHFRDLPGALTEVARVLRPSGRFVMEDSLAPDDAAAARFLEDLEKLRDATHVHTLSRTEWQAAFDAAGLAVVREQVFRKTHDFVAWLGRVGLEPAAIERLQDIVLAASVPVRELLFTVEGDTVTQLLDSKLIVRLERASSRPSDSVGQRGRR
jgi:SAM-dependent methyltransferase